MKRLYVVNETTASGETCQRHLVWANSQSQAVQIITAPRFNVAAATPSDVAQLMEIGVKPVMAIEA